MRSLAVVSLLLLSCAVAVAEPNASCFPGSGAACLPTGRGLSLFQQQAVREAVSPISFAEEAEAALPEMDRAILDQCYDLQNIYRAKEGLPALVPWYELEVCTQKMAREDLRTGRSHGAFGDYAFPDECEELYARSHGQNGCPGGLTGDPTELLVSCMPMMWNEKLTANCQQGVQCGGHYVTLRGGDVSTNGYNGYDRVACGYWEEDGDAFFYMNFGQSPSKQDYLCGGDKGTKPSEAWVTDCAEPGSYSGCPMDYSRAAGCGPTPEFEAGPAPVPPTPAPTPPPTPTTPTTTTPAPKENQEPCVEGGECQSGCCYKDKCKHKDKCAPTTTPAPTPPKGTTPKGEPCESHGECKSGCCKKNVCKSEGKCEQ